MIYNEDTLVQQTTADYLLNNLVWDESINAMQETFGQEGTLGRKSDTEVVLKLYEHYGDDFLLRLRGMFALAIYDKRAGSGRERLLLARDSLGIKPLLIARTGGRIVFASEMKALLASG